MIEYSIEEARQSLLKAAVFEAESIRSSDEMSETYQKLIPFFLARRDVDSAAELADSIVDTLVRDRELGNVVARCVEIEDEEYADQLVEAITESSAQNVAREKMAFAFTNQGKLDRAHEIAADLDYPAEALSAIAVAEARGGDRERSLETLGAIDFSAVKIGALEEIAKGYAKAGDKSEAINCLLSAVGEIDGLDFPEEKIRALCTIGTSFADLDDNSNAIQSFGDAREMASGLSDVARDENLVSVALGFLHAGSMNLADLTLDQIKDKVDIASTLIGFSREFLRADEQEEALEALDEAVEILRSQHDNEIRSSNARMNAFGRIAEEYAAAGNIDRAWETADEILDPKRKRQVLRQIALLAARAGSEEEAIQTIARLDEEQSEVTAYMMLSDYFGGQRESEKASRYLSEALDITDSIELPILRADLLPDVILRYGILGKGADVREKGTDAIRTIGEIKGIGTRAQMLAKLSDVYDRCGFTLNDEEQAELETILEAS